MDKYIDRLIKRNHELTANINHFCFELSHPKSANPILELGAPLDKLLWAVSSHLLFEEKILYPRNKQYLDQEREGLVKNFIRSLSATRKAIDEYREQWSNYYHITKNGKTCLFETKILLLTCSKLLEREAAEIYPLFTTSDHHITTVTAINLSLLSA